MSQRPAYLSGPAKACGADAPPIADCSGTQSGTTKQRGSRQRGTRRVSHRGTSMIGVLVRAKTESSGAVNSTVPVGLVAMKPWSTFPPAPSPFQTMSLKYVLGGKPPTLYEIGEFDVVRIVPPSVSRPRIVMSFAGET